MHEDNGKSSKDQQWQRIEEHYESGRPIAGLVTKATRERMFVDVEGIQGTVEHPTYGYSFSSNTNEHLSPEELFEHCLEQMQGQTLPLKVIEFDRMHSHLLLSQQLYREEERQIRRTRQAQLLQEIQPGDMRRGIVISLTPHTVSADVEGVAGWIPRYYLSLQNRRVNPNEVVHIGQEIEMLVLENDKNRLFLSLVHAQQRDTILQTLQIGQMLTASILSLSSEGAFVDLGGPIGFIPADQIVHGYITHPADVFHKGQDVVVRIAQIDANKKVTLFLLETP